MTEARLELGSWGTAFIGRPLGEEVRRELSLLLREHSTVVISLQGAEVLSPSFADEAFAKPIVQAQAVDESVRVRFVDVPKGMGAMLSRVVENRRELAAA
jgi:STAS-like domain of unknown function (DUF4325)